MEKNPKKKKRKNAKKQKKIQKDFLRIFFSLPPENPPEDRNSGIRSFTGPDGPDSASKTTGRTGNSIYSPAKRPGQPEINFTGFLDTLIGMKLVKEDSVLCDLTQIHFSYILFSNLGS